MRVRERERACPSGLSNSTTTTTTTSHTHFLPLFLFFPIPFLSEGCLSVRSSVSTTSAAATGSTHCRRWREQQLDPPAGRSTNSLCLCLSLARSECMYTLCVWYSKWRARLKRSSEKERTPRPKWIKKQPTFGIESERKGLLTSFASVHPVEEEEE